MRWPSGQPGPYSLTISSLSAKHQKNPRLHAVGLLTFPRQGIILDTIGIRAGTVHEVLRPRADDPEGRFSFAHYITKLRRVQWCVLYLLNVVISVEIMRL